MSFIFRITIFISVLLLSCSTASSDRDLFDYFSTLKRESCTEPANLILSKYSDSVKVGETYKFKDNITNVNIEYSDGMVKNSTFDYKSDFDLKCYEGDILLENNTWFGYIYDKTESAKEVKIRIVYVESVNYIDEEFIKKSKIITLQKEFILSIVN